MDITINKHILYAKRKKVHILKSENRQKIYLFYLSNLDIFLHDLANYVTKLKASEVLANLDIKLKLWHKIKNLDKVFHI